MKRVVITGNAGGGKTTLSKQLGVFGPLLTSMRLVRSN